MSFLDRIMTQKQGICETCVHLILVKEDLLGCKAHDKLVIPEFLPYTNSNNKCKDWETKTKKIGESQ